VSSVLNNNHDEAAFKAVVLGSVVIFALSLLVLRLGWLQILFHQHYVNQAVENSTRVTFLRAPRGSIYDRHGNLLATNKQSLSLIAVPAALEHMEEMSVRLSKILSLDKTEVLNRLMKAKASGLVLPVVIEHDLDMDIVSRFYEQKIFLEGIDILPDISRTYPNADATAHVLGYCREITENQLKDRPQCKMGDVCGQAGRSTSRR